MSVHVKIVACCLGMFKPGVAEAVCQMVELEERLFP
jgi:hypothetical protein